jgi:diguanylate cyclase (GGDEF)-like protein
VADASSAGSASHSRPLHLAAPAEVGGVPTAVAPVPEGFLATLDGGMSLSLQATLDLLATTIVNALGFEVAVVNLARPDGSLEVVSCAGPSDVRDLLLGRVDSQANWERILAASVQWGRLRFLDHANVVDTADMLVWIPQMEILDTPDAWHPDDALFAPLYASDGSLLGVLSVDLPRNGHRPDKVTCDALEAFAVSAALALEHATLRSRTEQAVKGLRHLASHDTVTGVANRSLLLERLRAAVDARNRDGVPLAVLFIDLNGFKRVNDAHSHSIGDQVLRAVAQRLCSVTRPPDTVARWGGDEFTILVGDVRDQDAAGELAVRVEEAVSQPITVNNDEFCVTASIGLVYSDETDTASAEDLMHHADSAMYEAKRRGGPGVSTYDTSLRRANERRALVEEVLRTALSRNRLVLHYQPILAVHDGTVTAVEALLRLRTDDGELLYPQTFLPAAEELGLMVDIEHAVLREACREAKRWEAAGHDVRLSVNVCVRQLTEIDDFEGAIQEILDDTSFTADKLTCEITEHAYLDTNAGTLPGMRRLKASGITFSVDDFGTGFGSMTYLRAMPISEIKIDRSFVAHAPTERAAAAIVRAHAILATELGVRCVAEGVETQEQHNLLASVGIGFAQGFLYQAPVLATDVLGRLDALSQGNIVGQLTAS